MKKNTLSLLALGMMPAIASAQEHAAAVGGTTNSGSAYLAAGLCMGIASAVVGFSQSQAAVAALDGIGRNPSAAKSLNTPLILSLALMESIALFAFIIAIILTGK